MKNFKKVVAGLLAVLMLALSVNVSFAAETYTDKETVVVAKVNAAGIMTGTDKGFEPSKSLTRAEAAAIIVRMKGISESAVKTSAGATLFTDVAASHWASGYVNQASNLGIVKGVSATQFAPEREVTIAEFTTMAIRALGAGQLVDSEGTWPTNYVNFANEEKILDDVNGIYTSTATRMQAATIVANTLKTVMWEKSGVKTNGEITWQKSTSKDNILEDVLELTELKDVKVTAVNYKDNKVTLWFDEDEDGVVDTTETVVRKAGKNMDLSTLKQGYSYDGYYDEDEKTVLGLWTAESAKLETVSFTEITKVSTDKKSITLLVDGEEVKYDAALTAVYFNGDIQLNNSDAMDASKVAKSENLFGTAVLNNEDEITTIYLEAYTKAGVVKETTDTRVKFDTLTGSAYDAAETFKLDDKNLKFFVTKDGNAINVEDIEKDDVVFYYTDAAEKVYHAVVMNDIEEGKVTSTGSNYIKLDGEKLTVVTVGSTFGAASFTPDDEVKVILNEAGKVVAFKTIEGSGKWALVSSLEFVKNNKDVVKAQVTLTFADGTKSDTLEVKLNDASSIGYDAANEKAAAIGYLIGDADEEDIKDLNAAAKVATGSILGQVYDYKLDGSKVILKTSSKIKTVAAGYEYISGATKSYFKESTDVVYVNDSTTVLSFKVDSDDQYKINVKVLDLDEIEKSSNLDVQFVDVDSKTSVAKLVVINETTNKLSKGSSTGEWAIVTNVSTQVSKDAEFDNEVTVITSANKEELYYTDNTYTAITNFGELTLAGEEITGISTDDYAYDDAVANKYIAKEEDGILYFAADDASENTFVKSLVLSDNVVYIVEDEDGYSIASASDVEKLDVDTDDKYDAADASKIVKVLTYAEESGAPEIVAIIFTNVKA